MNGYSLIKEQYLTFASMTQLTERLHVYFVMNDKQEIRHSYVYIGFRGKIYHVIVLPRINALFPWQKQGVLITSSEEEFTHRFGFKYKHKVTRFTLLISENHAKNIEEQLTKLMTSLLLMIFLSSRRRKAIFKANACCHKVVSCEQLTLNHSEVHIH